MASEVIVYKNGAKKNVPSYDVSSWERLGWSTSPSGAEPKAAPTPEPAKVEPKAEPAREVTIYKGDSQRNVPSYDVASYERQGWSTSKATPEPVKAPEPSPTPSPASPPSGASLISDPAELSKYTEDQIWRDPASDRIYKLPGAVEPVKQPEAVSVPVAPEDSGQLNTNGLLEAWTRRNQGRATEQDVQNLEYAESKGWTPSGVQEPEEPEPVKQEIPGLNTDGLSEAYARKLAGTANQTDLSNIDYAVSKGWDPNADIAEGINMQDANQIINAQQDADINARSGADEISLRSDVESLMEQVRGAVEPDQPEPDAPDYEESLRDLRIEYGIDPLETQLNGFNSELEALYAQRSARIQAERDKTVATNVIAGRVSEVERNENERIAALERSIKTVTDQLNTKYSVVNSLMDAKQLDYTTAVQSYDAEMEANIALYNAARGIEDSLKTDDQRAVDNARSSAEILINGYAGAGLTFDQLSPTQQSTLTKLSVESGFDPGFYQQMLSTSEEVQSEIHTHVISDDKQFVTILYKNGTTAVIPTGLPAGSNVPAGGFNRSTPSSQEEKEIQAFQSDAADIIGKLDGGDIAWGTAWDQLHILYPQASPELIDQTLGGGYDPSREGANEQGYYGRANR